MATNIPLHGCLMRPVGNPEPEIMDVRDGVTKVCGQTTNGLIPPVSVGNETVSFFVCFYFTRFWYEFNLLKFYNHRRFFNYKLLRVGRGVFAIKQKLFKKRVKKKTYNTSTAETKASRDSLSPVITDHVYAAGRIAFNFMWPLRSIAIDRYQRIIYTFIFWTIGLNINSFIVFVLFFFFTMKIPSYFTE